MVRAGKHGPLVRVEVWKELACHVEGASQVLP